MDISFFLIDKKNKVLDALKKINDSGKGIVFVCDENNLFYGTITDGDIRRHLIRGGSLNDTLEGVMNRTPFVAYENEKKDMDYYAFMRDRMIDAIPILNGEGVIVDAISIHDQSQQFCPVNVPVVIMAGGKGTRLQPLTNIMPKPLIPIGNKTITEHIIEKFQRNGCSRFHMIVNYKKEFIKAYFQDHKKDYSLIFYDEEEYCGTGGGLSLLKGKIKETFILTNCDILIDDDYSKYLEVHKKEKNIITLVTVNKKIQFPYGILNFSDDGAIKSITEKPEYSFATNTGFYIIEPEVIQNIPNNTFIHMTDLIHECISNGYRVGQYRIDGKLWTDIGQMQGLEGVYTKLNLL